MVPFVFNRFQRDYYERFWRPFVPRCIHPKPRKDGGTTLIVALQLHGALTVHGHIARPFMHDQPAAQETKENITEMYKSIVESFKQRGEDPDHYIPRPEYNNRRQLSFPGMRSAIYCDTCDGTAVGQAVVTHDAYLSEYAEWKDAEKKRAAITGSIPPKYKGRVTIDFNAIGIGNDAYVQYQKAKLGPKSPDWNGYTPVFFSVLDYPELYPIEWLEEQYRQDGDLAKAKYPRDDQELWLHAPKAVFDWKDIGDAVQRGDKQYLCDEYTPEEIRGFSIYHGVDVSEGSERGDYQVCRTRALIEGGLWEVCPPLREKLPADVFARRVHERWKEYPGLMTVERNTGDAVLLVLKALGVPQGGKFFRGKDPLNKGAYKIGFNTTRPSKLTMISDYQAMLREGSLDIVSSNLDREAREFEWTESGAHVAEAPQLAGHHDDEIMADMILVQGMMRQRKPVRAGSRVA